MTHPGSEERTGENRRFVPLLCGAGVLIWFAVLWFLSSRPGAGGPVIDFPYFDKVLHFGYFFGGGGLLTGFLSPRIKSRWKIFLIAWLILAAVGISDEWHQLYTPGRSGGDFGDWLADILGAAAGIFTWMALHPGVEEFRKRRQRASTAEKE